MQLIDLTPNAVSTIQQWRELWAEVGKFERGRAWSYGDLFLAGRDFLDLESDQFYTFSDIAARILKIVPLTGIEPKTLVNWAMVANKFPANKRHVGVSWTMHRELVDLSLDEAEKWLNLAEVNGWAVEDLRQARAEQSPTAAKAESLPSFVPRRMVQDTVRWFKLQFESDPVDDWPKERRAALKREFQPLLDILHAL